MPYKLFLFCEKLSYSDMSRLINHIKGFLFMVEPEEETLALETQWENFKIVLKEIQKRVMEKHLDYMTQIDFDKTGELEQKAKLEKAKLEYEDMLGGFISCIKMGREFFLAINQKAENIQDGMTLSALKEAHAIFESNKLRRHFLEEQEKFIKALETSLSLFRQKNAIPESDEIMRLEEQAEFKISSVEKAAEFKTETGNIEQETSFPDRFPHAFSIWNTYFSQYVLTPAMTTLQNQLKIKRS